jgi:glycosyltransferase involved in cell wall biosynthesis
LKIIIVNYRYFISGGPERYLFNIKELLEQKGHVVIPFSVKNKRNVYSEYESYFIDPVSKNEEIYFGEYSKTNIGTVVKSFSRMFYSSAAKKKLGELIKDVKPDLIYVLHFQNKLSASVFDAAIRNGIPIVHRISDFGHICANAIFYRPRQKDICERCLHGSKLNAIANKCVYNSYVYSSIKVASLKFQSMWGLSKKIDAFVIPSKFTIGKLKLYGFPEGKLNHIPSFFNFHNISNEKDIVYKPFALYIGRLEPEKGLMTLIKAFEKTSYNLKIIGFSNTGFDVELRNYLRDKNHKIEFLGEKTFEEIQEYLRECLFTLVPSEWYDNFPNTILESFAFRKCVVATDLGSLKELVIDQETGLLFKTKDHVDLREKITELFNDESVCKKLGEHGFNKLNTEYSGEVHYQKLINLFNQTIQNFRSKNLKSKQKVTQ